MNRLEITAICLATALSLPELSAATWPPTTSGDTYILRYDSIHHPTRAESGMVVTQNNLASNVGQKILAHGGNAIDASVAVGFALAATLPRAGNLGGGGFMLAHIKGNDGEQDTTTAIDFRGEAPALANRKFYTKKGKTDRVKTKVGYTASTVPGTVAGLYEAHQRWGSLPWSEVIAPAIDLAEKGINISHDLAWALNAKAVVLSANPEACDIYFSSCSGFAKEGDILKQPALAKTLKLIAKKGADAFYKGLIAKQISDDMKKNGGLIRLSDLIKYKARVIEPISTDYRSYQVVSMPPPAGGLPLLQTLNIMEHFPLSEFGPGSAKSIHVMAESMKRSYAYRAEYLGDPRFQKVPVGKILN